MNKRTPESQRNNFEIAAERIVLAGLVKYGENLYYELNSLITEKDFYAIENQIIYASINELILNQKIANPSIPAILNTIAQKNPGAITDYDLNEYLGVLKEFSSSEEECVNHAKRVGRWSWIRQALQALEEGKNNLQQVTGEEQLTEILAKAEGPLQKLAGSSLYVNDIVDIRTNVDAFIDDLINGPPTGLGIKTGYPRLDKAIGNLRPGVHLCGARTKQGKGHLALALADNVAEQKIPDLAPDGIPTLYLDTETNSKTVNIRRLARLSQVTIDDLEQKNFLKNEAEKVKVRGGLQKMKSLPVHYYNIAGTSHDEWIGIMRRWLFKNVGFDQYGNAKPCLIILDYIKTMDLDAMGDNQEFQYLGQIATDLHNFTVKYQLPIFALIQLNRDGLTQSGQGVFAGSDRIAWLCSSLLILKKKEEQDFAEDPPCNGNRKLEVVDCRFGAGLQFGEYINLKTDYAKSTIIEGKTNLELRREENTAEVAPTPAKKSNPKGGQNTNKIPI